MFELFSYQIIQGHTMPWYLSIHTPRACAHSRILHYYDQMSWHTRQTNIDGIRPTAKYKWIPMGICIHRCTAYMLTYILRLSLFYGIVMRVRINRWTAAFYITHAFARFRSFSFLPRNHLPRPRLYQFVCRNSQKWAPLSNDTSRPCVKSNFSKFLLRWFDLLIDLLAKKFCQWRIPRDNVGGKRWEYCAHAHQDLLCLSITFGRILDMHSSVVSRF
jgi:hypothetical protein